MILLLACSGSPSGELLVLHTNDMHGHVEPNKATWLEGDPAIGGMRAIGAAIADHRSRGEVLVLDAGDLLSGSPYAELTRGGAKGGAMVEEIAVLDYDAWTVGNHEFDHGRANLEALLRHSEVPALSANVEPALPGTSRSTVVEKSGLRIGVIGVVTEELESVVAPTRLGESRATPVAEAVRPELERLDEQTDLLVVLSHIGVEADEALAAEVPGIDLIVGGHSHTPIREPRRVGDTWIVQAGSYARSLGTLRLQVEDDAIASVDYELVDLVEQPASAPPAVEALYADLNATVEAEWGQVLGVAVEDLHEGRGVLSDMGLWACARLREAAGTDLAVYNSGGLRAPFFAGELSRRDVYTVFPFDNTVVTFGLSAGDLRSLAARAGGDIQYAGMTLEPLAVGGEPVDEGRVYTVATNSFMFEKWSEFVPGTTPLEPKVQDRTVREVMEDAVRAGPVKREEAP